MIHSNGLRKWLGTFPGGIMFFLGCHLIDLVLQIKGKPDNIISLNKSTGLDGNTVEDFGMAVFEYKDGASFVKVNSTEVGGYARRQLVVTGTKQTVELKPFETLINIGQYEMFSEKTEYKAEAGTDRITTVRSDVFNRYGSMLIAFARMVSGEIKNPYSYDYELELYKTILKCCGVDNK